MAPISRRWRMLGRADAVFTDLERPAAPEFLPGSDVGALGSTRVWANWEVNNE